MEHCRAAERALVSALVLGEADPAELSGRLRPGDFTDPVAAVLFEAALDARNARGIGPATDLPRVLQGQGLLRRDGHPISSLLEWMPRLPVPAHPEAWATLVVAGAVARQVHASGVRLLQSVDSAREHGYGPGRVLAMAEAQRAAVTSVSRRWEELPQRWRGTLPAGAEPPEPRVPAPDARGGEAVGAARERALLAGLVVAPHLLGRLAWLDGKDFTDAASGALFGTLRRLHEFGHPVDVVTLAAAADGVPTGSDAQTPADVAVLLRPEQAFPTQVPFLARQVLAHAVIEQARAVGEDLVGLATAPGTAGGLGTPRLLTAARARLDSLRPHALRLERARGDGPARPDAIGRLPLTWSSGRVDRPVSRDRHAG
jgi:replicative DNA helicase